MKKLFISAILIVAGLFFSFQVKADLFVANYSGIQHNILLSDGSSWGVSATTGTTIFSGPTAAGNIWAMTNAGIPTLSGAPVETLTVFETGTTMVTSVETYPPMTGPYTVQYLEVGFNIYITYYP